MEYQSSDGAVEDGVAKKFKPFIVRYAVAAVRQRLPQQFGPMEGMTEFPAQRRTLHIPVSCPQFLRVLPDQLCELICHMLKVPIAPELLDR
jgi:hypothetical protein